MENQRSSAKGYAQQGLAGAIGYSGSNIHYTPYTNVSVIEDLVNAGKNLSNNPNNTSTVEYKNNDLVLTKNGAMYKIIYNGTSFQISTLVGNLFTTKSVLETDGEDNRTFSAKINQLPIRSVNTYNSTPKYYIGTSPLLHHRDTLCGEETGYAITISGTYIQNLIRSDNAINVQLVGYFPNGLTYIKNLDTLNDLNSIFIDVRYLIESFNYKDIYGSADPYKSHNDETRLTNPINKNAVTKLATVPFYVKYSNVEKNCEYHIKVIFEQNA